MAILIYYWSIQLHLFGVTLSVGIIGFVLSEVVSRIESDDCYMERDYKIRSTWG